jgi:protocatechuate 3,4-dioxygenase beta subunit
VRAVLPGGPAGWVHSGEDGSFELTGLPAGTVALQFRAPGQWDVLERNLHIPSAQPISIIVDARFPRRATGRVVAYDTDRPIENASVFSRTKDNTAAARTDAAGRFDAPAPVSEGSLLIQAPGYGPLLADVRKAGATYRLQRAAVLTGRVVRSEDGRPLADARVEVRDATGLHHATCDASGAFQVADLAPGEVFFLARTQGRVTVGARSLSTWPAQSNQRLSAILRAGETARAEIRMAVAVEIGGIVRDESGQPLAGVLVQTGHPPTGARTVTDGAGRFALTAASGRIHALRLWAPGHKQKSVRGKPPFEISLESAAGPCVVVTDLQDSPIPGARVTIAENYSNRAVRIAWTDTRGKAFVEPVGNGIHTLVVEAEGYATHRIMHRDAAEPTGVIMVRGKVPRVRALFADGTPVVGAYMTVRGAGPTTGREWRTDGDGWLHIGTIEGEDIEVTASYDRRSDDGSLRRWGSSGKLPQKGDLLLTLQERELEPSEKEEEAGPWFRVRVLDSEGRPVPAGAIHVTMQTDSSRIRLHSHGFDPDKPGIFSYSGGMLYIQRSEHFPWVEESTKITMEFIRAGTVTTHYGHESGRALPLGTATLGPIPMIGEHEVRLPPEKTLRGKIVDQKGAAVPGILVWAWSPDRTPGERPVLHNTWGQYGFTRTQADGSFVLGRLGPGPVDVVVESPKGFLPAPAVRAAPGTPVTISLSRGAQPRVRVTDTSGQALAGASVGATLRVWPPALNEKLRRGSWLTSWGLGWRTDKDGYTQLSGLVPGATYSLRVRPPRDRAELAPESVGKWEPGDLEVRLGREATITGQVVDSEGRPRPEAYVYARFANGAGAIVQKDPQGRFKLTDVPAGEVTFTARIDGRVLGTDTEAKPVTVQAGAKNVRIVIEQPPSITIQFEDWPKGEFQMVELRSEKDNWRGVKGSVDKTGRLHVVGVNPAHTWQIWVALPDGRYAWLKGLAPSRETKRARLVRGGEIRGRVHAPQGAEDIEVGIAHRSVWSRAIVDDRGEFVLRGVPPGRWKIVASASVGKKKFEAETEAEPGGTADLNLR